MAATLTWSGGTGNWNLSDTNWSGSVWADTSGSADIATFGGTAGTVTLGTNLGALGLVFSSTDYTVATGSNTLTLGASGIDASSLSNGTTTVDGLLGLAGAQSWNAGSGATLAVSAGISAASTGTKVLTLTGSGNIAITGAISAGSGAIALSKSGTGTFTLSGGAALGSQTGLINGIPGSAVLRGGTTTISSGAYTASAEVIVGGYETNGGAGVNTAFIMDGGSFTTSGYLSLGRGNGTGSVSSDIVLNNSASLTAANFSAGFNGGGASNQPKGTFTLNGASSFTNTGVLVLGESAGSNMTMTLNDSSTVIQGTGVTAIGNQNGTGILNINSNSTFTNGGEIRVAYSGFNGTYTGSGTINVNGGTLNTASLTVGRNNNDAASTLTGTVNVNSGTVNVTTGASLVGWRGTATSGTINISGGSFNQGTSSAANMNLGSFSGATGTVNVSGGSLNLDNNSSLTFSNVNGASTTGTLTISGGDVMFYSNAGSAVGGTGVVDLMTNSGTGTNTINLNGGTLTANQIKATNQTGTRLVNFNGGTLKSGGSSLASTFFASGVATTANVRNGGAIIDSGGNNVTIGQALVHSTVGGDNATDGGLTKSGSGTLTLASANTYTGLTTISAGTLALASSGTFDSSLGVSLGTSSSQGTLDLTAKSAFSFGSSQSVSGYGTINIGTGKTVTIDGALAPGNSPGVVSVTGSLVLGSVSTTAMEIAGTGTAGIDYDLISVSESLTYGGALTITFLDSYAPTGGESYHLFDFQSYSGTFSSVTITGMGALASTAGGFNSTYSGLTYAFTNGTGILSVTASAIPEPSTYAVIFGALALASVIWQRRRHAA